MVDRLYNKSIDKFKKVLKMGSNKESTNDVNKDLEVIARNNRTGRSTDNIIFPNVKRYRQMFENACKLYGNKSDEETNKNIRKSTINTDLRNNGTAVLPRGQDVAKVYISRTSSITSNEKYHNSEHFNQTQETTSQLHTRNERKLNLSSDVPQYKKSLHEDVEDMLIDLNNDSIKKSSSNPHNKLIGADNVKPILKKTTQNELMKIKPESLENAFHSKNTILRQEESIGKVVKVKREAPKPPINSTQNLNTEESIKNKNGSFKDTRKVTFANTANPTKINKTTRETQENVNDAEDLFRKEREFTFVDEKHTEETKSENEQKEMVGETKVTSGYGVVDYTEEEHNKETNSENKQREMVRKAEVTPEYDIVDYTKMDIKKQEEEKHTEETNSENEQKEMAGKTEVTSDYDVVDFVEMEERIANNIINKIKDEDLQENVEYTEHEKRILTKVIKTMQLKNSVEDDVYDNPEKALLKAEHLKEFALIESDLDKVKLRCENCYYIDDYYILCDKLGELSTRTDRVIVKDNKITVRKKLISKKIRKLEDELDKKFEHVK